MASKNLTIQNALVSILKLITKANGYHNDIRGVTKRFQRIDSVSCPAITVMRGGEDKRDIDEGEELSEVKASFAIVGYVKATSSKDGGLNDAADELIEDIQEAILKNTQAYLFGGVTAAVEVNITHVDAFLEEENDGQAGSGHVAVTLVVKYFHDSDV